MPEFEFTPLTIVVYEGVILPAGVLMPLLLEEDKIMTIRIASKEEILRYENRPEQ